MKNNFITYFILFLLLPSYVLAIEPDCPWVLSAIFAQKDLDNIDPSEKIALQNILQNIYKNPKAKISTADLKWIEEYKIQPVVDELIQTANRRKNLESRTNLTGVTRKALTALGLALTAGGLYYLSTQEKESEKKDLKKSEMEWALTKELNETYGLNLRVEFKEDLELLKAILECSPNHRKKPLTQWIYDKSLLPDHISSDIRHGILEGVSYDRLISFLAFGDADESYRSAEILKKYWREYHIVFCTAFGNPLQVGGFGHNFRESLDFSNVNPQFIKNNKEPLKIITLTERKEHGFVAGAVGVAAGAAFGSGTANVEPSFVEVIVLVGVRAAVPVCGGVPPSEMSVSIPSGSENVREVKVMVRPVRSDGPTYVAPRPALT
jgi:hypothetical protein